MNTANKGFTDRRFCLGALLLLPLLLTGCGGGGGGSGSGSGSDPGADKTYSLGGFINGLNTDAELHWR